MSWVNKVIHNVNQPQDLFVSSLFNEMTFYEQFVTDLEHAKKEIIIESPFITTKRLNTLMSLFTKLKNRNINMFIITRNPNEHDRAMAMQSELGIRFFENTGIQVLLANGGHHRKLAIIDRNILYEGSLNILSQSQSREFMRRIESRQMTEELFKFLNFDTLSIFNKNEMI